MIWIVYRDWSSNLCYTVMIVNQHNSYGSHDNRINKSLSYNYNFLIFSKIMGSHDLISLDLLYLRLYSVEI